MYGHGFMSWQTFALGRVYERAAPKLFVTTDRSHAAESTIRP